MNRYISNKLLIFKLKADRELIRTQIRSLALKDILVDELTGVNKYIYSFMELFYRVKISLLESLKRKKFGSRRPAYERALEENINE